MEPLGSWNLRGACVWLVSAGKEVSQTKLGTANQIPAANCNFIFQKKNPRGNLRSETEVDCKSTVRYAPSFLGQGKGEKGILVRLYYLSQWRDEARSIHLVPSVLHCTFSQWQAQRNFQGFSSGRSSYAYGRPPCVRR